MNETLKEIAQKAKVEHCISHVRLQEFAELIVRECARVADASNQLKNRPAGVSVGDVVRQTFGVK